MAASKTSKGSSSRGGLWQVPLLVASLGVFGFAVYKFSDPGPGATVGEKIAAARNFLKQEQVKPTLQILNAILEQDKPTPAEEAKVRLMMAEALDVGQKVKRLEVPENYANIVVQTRLAEKAGAKLKPEDYRRLGEALEALGKKKEAIKAFEKAVEGDNSQSVSLGRRMIKLQLDQGLDAEADALVASFLEQPKLTDGDRAWAMGEKAQLLLGEKKYPEARELLGQILKLDVDDVTRGTTAYRYGLCALELGETEEAERQFRLARELLKVGNALDAEAAYRLGAIAVEKGRSEEAITFFNQVIVSHPGSEPYVVSRAGRGVARIMKGDDDAGLGDLEWASEQLQKPEVRERNQKPVLAALQKAEGVLTGRQNYQGAMELLAEQKVLIEKPGAGFWGRVASVYEKRADQVEHASRRVDGPEERDQLIAAARQLRAKAGDAAFSYSISLTVLDNEGYGAALWRAMELYDKAGATDSMIRALEAFTQERPGDTLAPDALLRLGRAYMTVGQLDKAIESFQRNQFRYPKSYAANQSGVPLAQALIAKGGAGYERAERVLLDLVEDNRALTPQATEFRNALFELAQLYYRQGRYEESIARFDEVMKRYPDDERMGQILFLMADAYRKSATLLQKAEEAKTGTSSIAGVVPGAGMVKAQLASDMTEAETARRQRLGQAKKLFERVVSYHRDRIPTRDIDRSQQRLAHFYRADCAFDLGMYDEAIRLYDQAAFRYQDDASALAAYVQIVNANVSLGKLAEAKSANERAKWLLRRMPQGAFTDGSLTLSRAYWEQWLKWSGETGVWPK